MSHPDTDRRLVAILSADVAGYSRLMAQDEEATVRTLTAYREGIRLLIQQHRGRVVDSPGDNLLAEFPTALDAVRAAVEIQAVQQARNEHLPSDRRMEYRIGVHLGDVRVEGERVYGNGVNIAARLEGLAEPGGVCISGAVQEQVESKLSVAFEDLGPQDVKNIPRPVRAIRLRVGGGTGRETPPAPAGKVVRRPGPVGLVLSAGVLLVVVSGLWALRGRVSAPGVGAPSVAVLPFDNLSGDPEQEYFADGLTEDLITDLSKVSGLIVIARNSVFTYKGQAVRIQDVGVDLDVRYVVEGSVRRAGDRVRITAQLVEAETGHHLWADRFDRELEDIFRIQDEVTREIVSALEVRIAPHEESVLERVPTTSLEAWDLYQQASVYASRMGPEGLSRAKDLYLQAIDADPDFALPYAGLAGTYVTGWYSHLPGEPDPLGRALELSRTAVRLDDSDPVTVSTLASVLAALRRTEEALAAARRAVELAPGNARALSVLGSALADAGRFDGGLREMETASRLDPFDPYIAFTLGAQYFLRRRYDDALRVLRRAVARTPDFVGLHGMMAVTYAEMGALERARAEAKEIGRISPDFTLEQLRERNLARIYAVRPESAERILEAARRAGLE